MRNDPAIAIILSLLFSFTVLFGGLFGWLATADPLKSYYLISVLGSLFLSFGISFLLSVLVTLIFRKND